MAADLVVRLDRSKEFGECRGERTPDDPIYRVHYWQGGVMGGHKVVLPFDTHGELVPDDGKTEKFQGMGFNAKGESATVWYEPLWDDRMRKFLKAKLARMAALAAASPGAQIEDDEPRGADDFGLAGSIEDEVNFASWLRGERKYAAHALRAAAKKRYSRTYGQIYPDLVIDLVLDEHVVPESEVCDEFRKSYLPKSQQAA